MRVKSIVALTLIAIFLGVLLLSWISPYFIVAVIALCAMTGLIEVINTRKESSSWPIGIKIFTIVAGMLMIFWTFFIAIAFEEYTLDFSDGAGIPTLGLICSFITLFFMTLSYKEFEISDATYLFTMLIFITLGGQSFLYLSLKHTFVDEAGIVAKLSYPENLLPLFFVMVITYLSDTGGYIIGYFFGKRKLNPRISPKKTIEGAIGATAFGIIGAIPFAFIPALRLQYYGWYGIIILGAILAVGAQFGDFMFSAIKRHYKIKDFGNLIPRHGGILDRIDSLLVNSMLFMVIDVLIIRYNNIGAHDLIKFFVDLLT